MATENYGKINEKEFRLMWQQRDPTLRITSRNNLIVRNLPKDIVTTELSGLFEKAGTIISCKISKNARGNSEGFGFVQFFSEEESQNAIDMFNDTEYQGKKILVSFFEKQENRNKDSKVKNLFFKNLPGQLNDDECEQLFRQ